MYSHLYFHLKEARGLNSEMPKKKIKSKGMSTHTCALLPTSSRKVLINNNKLVIYFLGDSFVVFYCSNFIAALYCSVLQCTVV